MPKMSLSSIQEYVVLDQYMEEVFATFYLLISISDAGW